MGILNMFCLALVESDLAIGGAKRQEGGWESCGKVVGRWEKVGDMVGELV